MNRAFATLYMRGLAAIAMAAGVTAYAQPVEPRALDVVLEDARDYEFGEDRTALSEIEQLVLNTAGDAEAEADIAGALADYVEGDVSIDTQRFVLDVLRIIANEDTVSTLRGFLDDPELSHLAYYALEPIPSGKADSALIWGLKKAEPRDVAGIASTLGARGSEKAASALKKLLDHEDADIQAAAAAALGQIGGRKATNALFNAHKDAEGAARNAIEDGLVTAATNDLHAGSLDDAEAIYQALYEGTSFPAIKAASLAGLAEARANDALPLLTAAMDSGDANLTEAAVKALQHSHAPGATEALVERVGQHGPQTDVLLLKALSIRREALGRDAVVTAAASPDARVRMAAFDALGTLGDASTVTLLIEGAIQGERQEQEAARTTLSVLPGDSINRALMDMVESATLSTVRSEALRALGSRNAREAIPVMFQIAATDNAVARDVALDTLGVLCGPDELADLVDILVIANGTDVQANAERAVVETASKIPMDGEPAAPLVAALAEAGRASGLKSSILTVLGRIGDPSALDEVRAAASGDNKGVQRVAVQALAEWPTPITAGDLAALAESTEDAGIKEAAFRGFVQQLRAPSDRGIDETIALYERAIALAGGADDRKLILAGLGEIEDAKALAIIEPFLNDADVRSEAEQAAAKVREATQ